MSETLAEKCGDFFILGDSGYPCLKHLLTPFKDRGNLTRRQRNYNYLLSKNRYLIEHCFGLLKQKFRQLYHLKLRNIQDIVHFIRACAVLHNLSIENNFDLQDDELVGLNEEVAGREEDVREEYDDRDDRDGIAKRNEVMNSLPFQI